MTVFKKITVGLLAILSLEAHGAPVVIEAPFGFKWGETVPELESRGILTSANCVDQGPFTACSIENAPVNVSM